MSREGTCIACHQESPEQSLAFALLHHVAAYTGHLPRTTAQHDSLIDRIVLSSAWSQVLGVTIGLPLLIQGTTIGYRRWKQRTATV